jgi:hypothetical protein
MTTGRRLPDDLDGTRVFETRAGPGQESRKSIQGTVSPGNR